MSSGWQHIPHSFYTFAALHFKLHVCKVPWSHLVAESSWGQNLGTMVVYCHWASHCSEDLSGGRAGIYVFVFQEMLYLYWCNSNSGFHSCHFTSSIFPLYFSFSYFESQFFKMSKESTISFIPLLSQNNINTTDNNMTEKF